jgi:hypothetical protein
MHQKNTPRARLKRFWRSARKFVRGAKRQIFLWRSDLAVQVIQKFPQPYRDRMMEYIFEWFRGPEASPYQHVNRCIYCRSTKKLSDEHIVPANLGGSRVLFRACCERCRLIIHPVETHCLAHMKYIRYRRGIGLRNIEKRPAELDVWVLTDWDIKEKIEPPGKNPHQKWERRKVPYSQHLTYVALPQFKLPGIRRGLSLHECGEKEAFVKPWFSAVEPWDESQQPMYVETTLDNLLLIRMIAKIAHCVAIWEFGLDNIEPLLPPLILGKDISLGYYLVGGNPRDVPREDNHFSVQTMKYGAQEIAVGIRLFSDLGAPVYFAVVGKHLKN